MSRLADALTLTLSRIETALLRALALNAPRATSVEAPIGAVWGVAYSQACHETLRGYIGYLRTKLAISRNVTISTRRGRGYAVETSRHAPVARQRSSPQFFPVAS